jgi:hypothetical protein
MSSERFETELRALLHEEAAAAPVQLSLHELRARAGRRSRLGGVSFWPMITTGVAVVGIAVLAVFVAILPRGNQSIVGGSPSPSASSGAVAPSASGSAAVAPSTSPQVSTEPGRGTVDLGPPGTIVVARASGDRLDVVGIAGDGTESTIATIPSLAAVLGDWSIKGPLQEELEVAISPDGYLAASAVRGDIDNQEYATVVLDLARPASPAISVGPSRAMAFAPGGELVLEPANERVLLVYQAPYNTAPKTITLPDGVEPARPVRGSLSFLADGSGVVAWRGSATDLSFTNVVIGLDGTLSAADLSSPTWFVTGVERSFGATGQQLGGGCDSSGGATAGGCVIRVLRPDGNGTNIEPKSGAGAAVWSRDGQAVIMVTATELARWDGTTTRRVRTVPSGLASDGNLQIVGLTNDAVLTSSVSGEIAVLPFDGGTPTILHGTLVAVVR